MMNSTQLETAIKALRAKLEEFETNLANLIEHVSTKVPSVAELNRIRAEIILLKETLVIPTAESTEDLATSNLAPIYTEINKISTSLVNMTKQLNAIQIQLDDLTRGT